MLVYLLGIYILAIVVGTIVNVLIETLPLKSKGIKNKFLEIIVIVFWAIPLVVIYNFLTLPFTSAKNWMKKNWDLKPNDELKEINEV